jgi:hypothetical protein
MYSCTIDVQVVEREKDVQDAREMLARVREARDAAGLLAERGEERMIHMQGMLKASDEALAEKRRTMGVLNMFYVHDLVRGSSARAVTGRNHRRTTSPGGTSTQGMVRERRTIA